MEIVAEIAVDAYDDATKSIKDKVEKFRKELQQYKVGNLGSVIGDIYRIDYKSGLFQEIMKANKSTEEIDVYLDFIYKYNETELNNAKMFWLNPIKTYTQSREYYTYPCETCACKVLKNTDVIKVSKTLKGREQKKIFKFGEGLDELACVSIGLYDYLIENGIKACDFKPVYKTSYLQAYAFAPEKEYNIRSSAYDYHKCSMCGREYAFYNTDKKYEPETFELCDKVDFSEHDVFRTSVYYYNEPQILISPKLFNLIKDYVKDEEIMAAF